MSEVTNRVVPSSAYHISPSHVLKVKNALCLSFILVTQDDGSMSLIITIVPQEVEAFYNRRFEPVEAFDVLDAIYHPGPRQVYVLMHFKRGGWRLYWYDIDKDDESYYDASEFNYEDHAVPMRIYPFSKGIVAVFEVDDGNTRWLKIGSL